MHKTINKIVTKENKYQLEEDKYKQSTVLFCHRGKQQHSILRIVASLTVAAAMQGPLERAFSISKK